MPETPASLLDQLVHRPDNSSWQRLLDLYTPLIRGWLQRDPSVGSEVDDLVQEVLGVVVRELAAFRRQRTGSFRAWLRTVTVNRLRAFWRDRQSQPAVPGSHFLHQLEDPASALSRQWDREHDQYVAQRLFEQIMPDFNATTVQAFRLVALEEQKPAEVAAALGLSVNAVLLAKSRVLRRLREVGAGLLDSIGDFS